MFGSEKNSGSRENYIGVLHLLKGTITTVHKEDLKFSLNKAEKISPDAKDASYIVLVLKSKFQYCQMTKN